MSSDAWAWQVGEIDITRSSSVTRLSAFASKDGAQLNPPLAGNYASTPLMKSDLKALLEMVSRPTEVPVFLYSSLKLFVENPRRHPYDDAEVLRADLVKFFAWLRTPVIQTKPA